MIRIPPYLKKGACIGLVCPAGFMELEKAQTCINTLQDWGYDVRVGNTLVSKSDNYFSGNDDERLEDFQRMLDDDKVNAIMCARGGYGFSRIIDRLDFSRFRKKPKWIIGYSDVTVLHCHVYSNFSISTMHAPMAAAFNEGEFENEYIQSLKRALLGKPGRYQCAVHEFNVKGEATGELVGGNLALLAHCIGTSSDIRTKGKILFLEDVGEYLYNIDRMFYQLRRSGRLDKLGGLVIGGFTDNKDTNRPFGLDAFEIIRDVLREYEYPICFDFPVSHERENYALKIGVEYTLKVGKNRVSLSEA